MLVVPVHSTIKDVTVFGDDADFWVFYLVPGSPSLRVDSSGNPVFLLVKYAFSDQDRQQNPSLPIGGGYLNFDTELSVADALLAEITGNLQTEVDAEWHRRTAGTPAEQASNGVAGTTAPPAVQFGTPTWTAGKVSIDAPQSTALISQRVAEGSPSLLGGATGVFDLDLTPAGASFMQQTLLTAAGAGATNLTPIQVTYDLSFWARLPEVSIIVTAQSEKVHDYVHKQLQGRGVDNCTTYDFDHTDTTTDSVTSTGLITVHIDQGSGAMPQDALTTLTNYALELVKQMISSTFFTSSPPATAKDPAMPADDGITRKWFRTDYDATTMNLNLNLQQRSVVTWQVHPQATMEAWFKGMSAAQLTPYVRSLDLTDPFFEDLEVTARAFGDYSGAIQSVTLDLQYGPDGSDQKVTSLVFTDTAPQTWRVGLIGSKRTYSYRYTVGYDNHDPSTPTAWTTTSSTQLTVEALAGSVDVTVLAGDIDFGSVAQVQVDLAYEDAEHGVPREEYTVLLTPTLTQARYSRMIYQPVTRSLQYRTRFTTSAGDVQTDGVWHDWNGPQLLINQDTTSLLRINLLPSGNGWADATKVVVELHYEDPANAFTKNDTIVLSTIGDFKTWTVGLKNKALRNYSYRWTASFAGGQVSSSDWQSVTDGSTTVPVTLTRPGITVFLVPDAIDFAGGWVVQVNCHYAQAGIDRQETFVFRDRTTQHWDIDAPVGAPVAFTYQVTSSRPGVPAVAGPLNSSTSEMVVIPAAQFRTVTALGQLVDYTATPMVSVDLAYDDDADHLHETAGLVLSAATTSAVQNFPVADPTQTALTYTITYYTPDGIAHPQPSESTTQGHIVVPRFQTATSATDL